MNYLKKHLHIIACCLIGLVSFILLAKDAVTVIVFEEGTLYEILEEDSEFEKIAFTHFSSLKRPKIHLSERPILYTQNVYFSAQSCNELYSPPPEV